jgi:excinuclease ABC subunit C
MPSELPEAVEKKLERLPAAPGAYLFLDAKGKVIYVGKASSLRARVRSYFGKIDDGRTYFPWIVRQARDLDWVVAASNQEALLLENNLIKRHKPKFNVKLVDDKTYLSIKLTTNEPFARALLVRRAKKDGALYFGPYGSASAIRQTLRTIRKFFPLRTCTNAEFRQRTRPCLQHQIGRCGAPCVGLQDAASYEKVVQEVALFLRGRTQELLRRLEAKMAADAEALRFEAAARTRDQIRWIESTQQQQRAVLSIVDTSDRDVFGEVREGDAVIVQAHFIREGKLVSTHGFTLRSELPTDEVVASFVKQFYAAERFLPDEVVLPVRLEDEDELAAWLTERKGRRVRIVVPERGEKREWVEMARENARRAFRDESERRASLRGALEDLAARLGLARAPRRIECYDISNISGAFAVGSLIAMRDGELDRGGYRKFRIRTLERTDDFAALAEVLGRRFKRAPELRERAEERRRARAGPGEAAALVPLLRAAEPEAEYEAEPGAPEGPEGDVARATPPGSADGGDVARGTFAPGGGDVARATPDRGAERAAQEAARWRAPDLIVIDGGLPQLAVAERLFAARGITGVELCAIAKMRREKEAGGRASGALAGRVSKRVVRAAGALGSERVFRPGSAEPTLLPEGSPAMHLLQRLRDEAHRFAIGYHRALRRARSFKTGLEEIPGVGPKRRRALLEHFGSLRRLREASIAEIAACPGMRATQAEAVHAFFHEGEGAAIPDEGRLREEESAREEAEEGVVDEGALEEGDEEPEGAEDAGDAGGGDAGAEGAGALPSAE